MQDRKPANPNPNSSPCNCHRVNPNCCTCSRVTPNSSKSPRANPNYLTSHRVNPNSCRFSPKRHVIHKSDYYKTKSLRVNSNSGTSQIIKKTRRYGSFLLLLAMALSCFAIVGIELWPGVKDLQDRSAFAVMKMVDESLSVITDDLPWRAQSNLQDSLTCDYSIGQWVVKGRGLYNHMPWSIIRHQGDLGSGQTYNGNNCKRWLSPMWACRLHPNRTNFAYESLIWKPLHCHLPPFNSNTFLHRMRNKIIAFIGDSLGRQQFQSLMCLLTHGKDDFDNVLDVGTEYGFPIFTKVNKSNDSKKVHQSNWAYRFVKTNTTIIFSWSTTLCHSEPMITKNTIPISNNNLLNQSKYANETIAIEQMDIALHVDVPPKFLASNLKLFDVIILNSGPHWNRKKFSKNKWKIHINGKPINIIKPNAEVVNRYHNYSINNLMTWLNAQLEKGITKASIFYRSSSPHHFVDGEWDSGGHCDNTHYRFLNSIAKRRLGLLKTSPDPIGDSAIKGTKVKLLNITWLSQLRDEAHISKYMLKGKNGSQDCLHWCMPGVPDTWNQILSAELLKIEFQTKNESN